MSKYKSQESYANKMKAKGCVRVMLWIPESYAKAFKKLARDKIKSLATPDQTSSCS